VNGIQAAVRVLVVDDNALGGQLAQGILGARQEMEVVHAGSLDEARARLRNETFDIVIRDETRLRPVLDAIFAFVGLFSPDGVVVDVNRVPLVSSGLARTDVVGRRFVDLPWFAHSATERARIADALARAVCGEKPRLETTIRQPGGALVYVDAAFAPLRDAAGVVTHVVGTGVDITARREAQDALVRSEARLCEAQRVAHVGSWEWDVAANTVSWSDELYLIYGLTRQQFTGTYQSFLSRVHPDDAEHTKMVITQALRSVTPFIYDHRVVRPDGRVRMLHTRGDVVADADGTPVRLVGSCWDVTDRWEATQKLEQSISLLRSTLEATADGILVVDRAGKVAALNERLRVLWRLPDEVVVGTDIQDVLGIVRDQLADPPQFLGIVTELYAQPELESLDVLRFHDGRVFERYSRPQRSGNEIVGRVCSFRDVTQRERLLRSAEVARAEAEKARGEMESVLERVSDGFTALDRQWRYSYVNSAGGHMLGRESANLVGKHIWTEFPEGVGQKFHLAYEQAMAEQRPIQLRAFYPPWNRWFENRIYPSPDGLSIFFTDVTEQEQTQARLRASADQLRALAARLDAVREEERREMAREIHDQIGQSLTALKLELAALRGGLAQSDPAAARRAGEMDTLLDQTLDTARRLSTALRPPILDDLGLVAAVEWQAREFEARTGVRCRVEAALGDEKVAGREALVLFRIVQEALTNVARHAQARTVQLRVVAEPDALVLTVKDDGRGITDQEKARSSSLGLLGMRERALVLGGTVTVEGAAGAGTTVTARLPRARVA
jgi:PAS domain S-box-containing protein